MRKLSKYGVLMALIWLAGCTFVRSRPTPLAWIPTATPAAGSQQAAEETVVVPTPEHPEPSATPSPLPETEQPEPTATATAAASPTAATQAITLEVPAEGQTVSNPLELRGRTAQMPFEGTLIVRIYDARDRLVAEMPLIAEGEYGQPATFTGAVPYGGRPGAGRVEILDVSPNDGSVLARAVTSVTLGGFPGGGYLEAPLPYADVTLPIQLLARAGDPGDEVNVTVTWDDGTEFAHTLTALPGLDGGGLVAVALDRAGSPDTAPPTQGAAIQIRTLDGRPLAWQPVRILNPDDPGTMGINVYWVHDEEVVAQAVRVPRTLGIGRAALETLLWGPVPQNDAGLTTALPLPAEVLNYGARGPDWGERVTLRSLTISDGTATADFSPEILAYPGGATRALLIREQIEQTLLQFSTVDDVVITVDGRPNQLEP